MRADASREAFEAAHSHLSTASLRRNGGDDGCYTTAATAFAWAMWQASRKQALEDVATLFLHESAEYFGSTIQEEIEALK